MEETTIYELCKYIHSQIEYFGNQMREAEREMNIPIPGSKTLYETNRLRYLSYVDIKDQMIKLDIWCIEQNEGVTNGI